MRRVRELVQPGAAEQLGKPLTGPLRGYRRVQVHGDHRLVYKVDVANDRIVVVALAHRKWVYSTMDRRVDRGEA
jgi:addiction module RelE/StbE family toxin